MVKIDIAWKLKRQEGILVGESEQLINDLIELIKETLKSGEDVLISGFGKFELREKKARPGRDPKSGKQYKIKARRVVTFSPSKVWRKEVNGDDGD